MFLGNPVLTLLWLVSEEGAAGACGTVHADSDKIVALDEALYDSSYCGKTLIITNTGPFFFGSKPFWEGAGLTRRACGSSERQVCHRYGG